jgi:putative transposase
MGNLLAVNVHAANIHDTKSGAFVFEKALFRYPTIIGGRADQGYRGTFKNTFENFHNIKIDISPRIKNEFEIQPIRWIVERTFGWMTWSRRLSKDYEINTETSETMCVISNFHTLLRRF